MSIRADYSRLQIAGNHAKCTTHRYHLPLRWHKSWSVADAEFSLECVEIDLQLALLLDFGWLVHTAIVTEVLQLSSHGHHRLFWRTILKPGCCTANPLQQLCKKNVKGLF